LTMQIFDRYESTMETMKWYHC